MPAAVEVLYNLFAPIVVAALFSTVAVGVGALILNPFLPKDPPPLVESFALGTLAISLVTLLWGMMGWMGIYGRLTVALPFILLGIAGWITARPVWALNPVSFKNRTVLVLSILLAVGVLLRIFLGPLYPPVEMNECRTHLPLAQALLAEGIDTFHPEITFSTFPQNAEMLYAWAIAWAPLSTSHYINFIAFIFSLLALVRLGRAVYSLKTGWLAALIMGAMGILQTYGSTASPGMWTLFYILCAALVVTEGTQERSVIKIILGGIFLGAAAGTGYMGLLAALTLTLSLFALGRIKGVTTVIPRWSVFVSFILFILIALPWYARNMYWFANPVFPFYETNIPPGGGIHGVFGAEAAMKLSWMHVNETAGVLFRDNLLWPWIVKMMWSVWIGIPAGIFFLRSSPFTRIAVTWTLLVWAFWMIPGDGIMHLPYFLFLVPFNILILANLLGEVYSMPAGDHRGRFFRIVLWVMLVGWVGIGGAPTSQLIPPLTSGQMDSSLKRVHGSYELIMVANDVIAEDRNAVGILCEDGRVYADFKMLGGDVGLANLRLLSDSSTSAEVFARLIHERYDADYLIVHENRLKESHSPAINSIRHLLGTAEFSHLFHEAARVGQGVVYIVDEPDQ